MGTRWNRLDEADLTGAHGLCFGRKYEEYQKFYLKNCHFLLVEFSVYLYRHVFVMICSYLHVLY